METLDFSDPKAAIKTLNDRGWMRNHLDAFSEEFLRFIPKAPGKILEVGAAYGVAALEAAKFNVPLVVNDLEPRHLDILMNRLPPQQRHLVKPIPGDVVNLKLEPGTFGAILACRVLHFLRGDEMEACLNNFFRALAPGGRLFLVLVTPFNGRYISLYPRIQERAAQGESWPGYFDNLRAQLPEKHREFVPDFCHMYTLESIRPVLTAAGFEIEKLEYINRDEIDSDFRLDGREDLGAVCVKR